MLSTIRSLLLASVLAAPGAVEAAEEFDPNARAKLIAPFIGEQTVGVVHVDLTRIEIDPFFDRLATILPQLDIVAPHARTGLKNVHGAFRKAGVSRLYLVMHLADLPRQAFPFFVIAPLGEATDVEALIANFPRIGRDPVTERLDGVLFAGPRRAFERVKAAKPEARPELLSAFEAAGDTAAQILLLPPAHAPRVIEEIMPNLPEEVGGGSSTILTRGLLWASVGVDADPHISLRLVIQSRDERAATALREKWLEQVTLLSAKEEARKRLPDVDKAASLLTPTLKGDRLLLTLSDQDLGIPSLVAAAAPPLEQAHANAKRRLSANNLKHLTLAMHSHHHVRKSFPAVGNTDDQGNLLLSWRVHVLPFLEETELYKQFHLDEPWDSPHNRKLIDKMPEVYRCPASGLKQKQGLSTYRVLAGEETVFPGPEGVPLKEIKDGTSHTILAVEVDDAHAVVWTKPEGLPLDPKNPAKGLGGQFKGGFNAAFCDGSVRFIHESIDPKILYALFTRAGREVVGDY